MYPKLVAEAEIKAVLGICCAETHQYSFICEV